MGCEIEAAQNRQLVALHIDLEEVNVLRGVGAENAVEGLALYFDELNGTLGVALQGFLSFEIKCRESGAHADAKVEGLIIAVTGNAVEIDVAGAIAADPIEEEGNRFNVDAFPATFIKMFGDGSLHRIFGAYIHIEAIFFSFEAACQKHIF